MTPSFVWPPPASPPTAMKDDCAHRTDTKRTGSVMNAPPANVPVSVACDAAIDHCFLAGDAKGRNGANAIAGGFGEMQQLLRRSARLLDDGLERAADVFECLGDC